ncbi:iron hydrogenase [Boletus reticuloceps]|uniref:Cytosolic Fe-S cluster assembly factor NAR1 n=1 Tax=Boletus reticuloceps TaxID=495285 RepID=A0A8I3AD90_9AGAM|nr:iron hydrogenase [Boletus reticuloceps]
MVFSGALTLTDLNDFITPSQTCIKPVEQLNAPQDVKEPGSASTEIRIDSSGSYYEVSTTPSVLDVAASKPPGRKLEQAQISLNDCLACSGCITSAESVLITLQSHTEVLHFFEGNPPADSPAHKVPVLSIAPQCLASLSATLSSSSAGPVGLRQVLRRVGAFCTQMLGFKHVYDTTFARHISLLEHTREFWERKRGGKLPMLASACPGWVCYAEKTHSEMLPFISRTKSPQQIMGTLVKSWLASAWGKQPDQIYHVTVMPCYDKKLEASRQDFYDDVYSTRDVDCVITTGELELLMREKGWDLSIPVPGEDNPDNPENIPEVLLHPGTSSGSYLHSLMSAVRLASPEPLELSVKTVRTSDYEEYTLSKQSNGEAVFKGAKCYGFRNLQNVVRKVGKEAGIQVGKGAAGRMVGIRVRAKKSGVDVDEKGYDYVEVMACPGGCVNGGGQLRPIGKATERTEDEEGYVRNWEENGVSMSGGGVDVAAPKWGNRGWTKEVEKAYWDELPMPPASPGMSSDEVDRVAMGVLVAMCRPEAADRRADSGAEERRRELLFRTDYRAVESEVIGLAVKW